MKYLVQWKGFTVEHNSWKREKDLENAKKLVVEFEGKIKVEVRRQEKLDQAEERDYRRGESCQEDIWQGCCMNRMMENLKINI